MRRYRTKTRKTCGEDNCKANKTRKHCGEENFAEIEDLQKGAERNLQGNTKIKISEIRQGKVQHDNKTRDGKKLEKKL